MVAVGALFASLDRWHFVELLYRSKAFSPLKTHIIVYALISIL